MWRPVVCGFTLQFLFGVLFIRWPIGRDIFECFGDKVAEFLAFGKEGAAFVFGNFLVEDEKVSQDSSLANGYVVTTPGAANGAVELTGVKNVFLLSDVSGDKYFSGANSAAQMKLTEVALPEVKDGSGEVIYKESMSPVARANNQTETFKLVLEF